MHEKDNQLIQKLVEQYSMMMDTAPIQMWFLSSISTYGIVNQHHADFLGKRKQEIEFKRLEEFLSLEIADVCRLSNQEVFDSKKTIYSEEWIPDSDGNQCLIKITKTPHFDQKGNIEYIVCFGIDVTAQKRAEEELLQNEENFRTLIETIDDIVLVAKLDGSIIYSNPVASSKLGYDHKELCKRQIIDLHPPYVRKEAALILSEMINGNQDVCPLPIMGKKGNIIPVETRVWLGKWNGTNCVFGLSKDLSREQEALQKFDRIFRINPALMAVSKLPDRTFTDVNDTFLQTLGYSKEEIIGKSNLELNLFTNKGEQNKVSKMLSKYGQIREIEMQVRTKQGGIRYGLFSGDIIENQGIKYALTVMVDITERRQAEATLRESEEKYQTLFRNMVQGAFYQKADGTLIDCNNAVLDQFGITRDQLMGKTSMDPNWKVIYEDGSECPGDEYPSIMALRSGEPVWDEILGVFNIKRKKYLWLNINAIPQFKAGQTAPYQVFVTLHDISNRKKLEKELKNTNQRLEDKVNERTAELEEMNAALKVLLKKNEKDMIEIEEKIISNYDSLILPFVRKLKETLPEKKQESLVDIIEFNLKKVTSAFSKKLNEPMKHLTPAEIQIASMIKQGLTNKEIANVLDNSVRTVTNHRENIRQKLNLKNTKINLRSFLSTL